MYTFKLQAVLDHRQFLEDKLNKSFAEIKQQVLSAQHQLARLEQKEMDTANALKAEQAQGISSEQVIAYHAYLRRLADHIVIQNKIIDALRRKEEEEREKLLAAMKKRKILEKLKDQGLEKYNQALFKSEMKFIDEIAVNQFARRTINSNGGGE